jgi:hypothetical protein
MNGVRFVKRPTHVGSGRPPIYPIEALLETAAKSDAALQIPVGKRRPAAVVTALTKLAARRGYRLRHQRRPGHILAWVEKIA